MYLDEKKKQHSFVGRTLQVYYKLAAVLLIPLLIGSVFLVNRYGGRSFSEETASYKITAPAGSRISFVLPDGSEGFLNSESTLEYRLPFKTRREVEIDGEAWFDVAKDASHPFCVNMGNSSVKVMGTRFNVNAYREDRNLDVVLESGSIEFRTQPNAVPVRLKPGEHLSFTTDGIYIENTDTEKYSGWTKGLLIFRGDNMVEVARRIERWYNVKVTVAHSDLLEYVFVGTFEDDSLEEVLALLAMTSPIEYEIVPRKKDEDGLWLKEEVILTKRAK